MATAAAAAVDAAAATAAEPPPPPPSTELLRCAFFVKSAGRACGLNVSRRRLVPGHPPLCPQHEPGAEGARVPCPVDPSHTVLKSALQAHLARCTAALRADQVAKQPWYRHGCNSGARAREYDGRHEERCGWETDAWSGPSSSAEEEGDEEEGANADADAAAEAQAAARERARPFRAAVGAHAGRAQRRAGLVQGLGFDGFEALVARLDAAHARLVGSKHPPVEAREGWRAAFCGGDDEEEDDAEVTLRLRARARIYDPMMPVDGKHARQHAAVAAVLRERGLLPPPPAQDGGAGIPAHSHPGVLVELGAGKGYLTAWLVVESCSRPPTTAPPQAEDRDGANPLPPSPPPFRALVMVDAAGHMGRKADRRLRDAAPLLARVTADLRDVNLARLPGLLRGGGSGGDGDDNEAPEEEERGSDGSFLAVGKHLCGVATDYALRAFANGVMAAAASGRGRQQQRQQQRRPRSAVAVATCCHHRGRWRDFCGRDAWREAGLSRSDFEAALWLCGWANSPSAVGAAAAAAAPPPPDDTPRAWHRRLSAAATEGGAPSHGGCPDAALGRRCRELLDAARCAWLEARLLKWRGAAADDGAAPAADANATPAPRVEHLFFVGPSVTPENRLILGVI